jgi:ubiquinone/menaquinone biosynthesis C-methylase UbiE
VNIRNLGAIINDHLRHEFIKFAFNRHGKRNELLDLGCGVKPFKGIYSEFCTNSVGIDVAASPHHKTEVDIIYDGKNIPFDDNRFDYVFCTEVMEHVPEPASFLKEIHRVMKAEGILIMTTPFLVPLHEEPHDYYRYTSHGINHLLSNAGFRLEHIESFSGYTGVLIAFLVQPQLKVWNRLSKGLHLKFIYSVFNPFIFLGVVLPQWIYLLAAGKTERSKNHKLTHYVPRGYGYVAKKI